MTDIAACPDMIVDFVGRYFAMGTVGGAAVHFFKGIYNSPKGARLVGACHTVRLNAPRVGVRFAVWGGLYAAFGCTLDYLRQKQDDDPLNNIISAASASGLFKKRKSLRASALSAATGGIVMALCEGRLIASNKLYAQAQHHIWFEENGEEPEAKVTQGKEAEAAVSSGSEKKVLESSERKEPQAKVLESSDALPLVDVLGKLASCMTD